MRGNETAMKARAAAVLLVLAVLPGCGTGADDRDARSAATRFEAAIQAHDGAAACDQLSDDASSKLESSEKKPCGKAILSIELKPSRAVVETSVWVTSAQVRLAHDTLFLDETPRGWKISAAGCKPQPEKPYDCELEG
jgi:hypothetical protein